MLINRPFWLDRQCGRPPFRCGACAAESAGTLTQAGCTLFRTRVGRSYGMLATQAELLTVARETMEHKVRELDPKREKLKQASTQACEVVP